MIVKLGDHVGATKPRANDPVLKSISTTTLRLSTILMIYPAPKLLYISTWKMSFSSIHWQCCRFILEWACIPWPSVDVDPHWFGALESQSVTEATEVRAEGKSYGTYPFWLISEQLCSCSCSCYASYLLFECSVNAIIYLDILFSGICNVMASKYFEN